MSTPILQIQPAGSVRMEQAVRKFHTSLNVSDLGRSIAFYRELFGIEPAKVHSDYAKFEIAEPPVILSLVPRAPAVGGNLNHAGVRMRSSEELVEVQKRLERAGFRTRREDGVECCYALQTKFWVTDPDQVLWEIYVFHEDIDHHGYAQTPGASAAVCAPAPLPVTTVWEHRLGTPLPERIPHGDDAVQQVRLQGTVNQAPEPGRVEGVLAEALRVLAPGGEVRIHGLAGDRNLRGMLPPLPGAASAVEHAPTGRSIARLLQAAGFADVRFEKLSTQAYFTIDGVPMREMIVTGRKPAAAAEAATHQAVYLGPLASVSDDFGNVFEKGAFTRLNGRDWQALAKGPMASHFLLLPSN